MSVPASSDRPRTPNPPEDSFPSHPRVVDAETLPPPTRAVSVPNISNRTHTAVWDAAPAEPDLHAEAMQSSASSAMSDANALSRQVEKSGRPKLVRRDFAVDLTAARQQFEYVRIVKQARAGNKLDIATPREMAHLIHWLESGGAPKSLHLECDFGGPRCYEDPDYDEREVLDGQLFTRLLQACRGIRKLVFDECRLSSESFHTLGAFLMQEGCKLEALSLIDEALDDKYVGHLSKALRLNRSLREFSVGGAFARVSSAAMAWILDAVAKSPSITVLQLEYIKGCMIWPWQLEKVLASGSCEQLAISSPHRVRLYLRDQREWDVTFAGFCEQLARDTALRSLDLSGYDLTPANIEALLAALQRNAHLERLELGRISLTYEQSALIDRCLELNEANNQAIRLVAEWQATKALDGLAPQLLAPGDIWPHELSQLIASMMDAATLEAVKKSGDARIDSGQPAPGKRGKSSRG